MIKDVGLLKNQKNKGDVKLTLSQKETNNSLKTDKYNDCNPYIVCIFVFTALIHCTLCRDYSLIFVSFQIVVCYFL